MRQQDATVTGCSKGNSNWAPEKFLSVRVVKHFPDSLWDPPPWRFSKHD